MSIDEKIKQMLTDAVQLDSAIEELIDLGDSVYEIQLADDEIVLVSYDNTFGRLMLSCELGVALESRRPDLNRLFLSYALMWRETGGYRVGCAMDGEPYELLADVFIVGLEPKEIAGFLTDFSAKARIWRSLVSSGPAEAVPDISDFVTLRV